MHSIEILDIAREWSFFEGAGTQLSAYVLGAIFLLLGSLFKKTHN
jgi:hypothetical protein